MALELTKVNDWLTALVAGDGWLNTYLSGLGAFADVHPGIFPACVYEYMPGNDDDVTGVGAERIMIRPLYLVRLILDRMPQDDDREAADRLDDLLSAQRSAVFDGYEFNCWRTAPYRRREPKLDGNNLFHLGGLYRIEASPAN